MLTKYSAVALAAGLAAITLTDSETKYDYQMLLV